MTNPGCQTCFYTRPVADKQSKSPVVTANRFYYKEDLCSSATEQKKQTTGSQLQSAERVRPSFLLCFDVALFALKNGNIQVRSCFPTIYNITHIRVIIKKKVQVFYGARNRYCSICITAKWKDILSQEHECYRNWKGKSPNAMEANIICEGFRKSKEMHDLKFTGKCWFYFD